MKLVKASLGRLALLILFTVGLFGCDYATKSAAKATLEGTDGIAVAPDVLRGAVELRYVENEDIAFSVLRRLGIPRSPELLATLAAVALAIIVGAAIVARRKAVRTEAAGDAGRAAGEPAADEPGLLLSRAGLALIVSGALGNLVDRIVRGYVVDFIHVKGWPVFNVADIAVVVGVGLIGLAHLRRRRAELASPTS
jgi:signal peptidase II